MKIKNLKRLYLFVIFIVVFGCKDNKKNDNNSHSLNVLLSEANNFNYSIEERKKLIQKSEKIIETFQNNDSIVRENYFKLAGRFYNIDDLENYHRISKKVLTLSKQSKNQYDIARSLNYVGDYYFTKFKNDSAYYYFTKAEKKFDSLSKTKDLIRVKFSKSDILLFEKDFSGAEVETIKILKIAKAINDNRLVYDCLVNLGNALVGLNNIDEAIGYYLKALTTLNELTTDPQYLELNAQTYNCLGKAYAKKEDYYESINYYDKGIESLENSNTNSQIYSSLIGNKAYSQLKLGEFELAEVKLFEALHDKEKEGNIPGIVYLDLHIGELFITQKEYKKAYYYLNRALVYAQKNEILEDELKALRLLSKLNLPNKSKLYERYIELSDSLLDSERANRNKFARIEYETDEILNEKKIIQHQKEEISSQRWYILFGSSGLILLLGLIYNSKMQYNKNKQLQFEREQQESNEQIYKLMLRQQTLINDVRQEEKKRISQDLHDGVMSRLTSTRLNLFILSKKNDPETIRKCLIHIEKIQDIEKELRNISHDLNKESLLEKDSFKVIINDLFEEYCEAINVTYQIKIDKNIAWNAMDNTLKIHLYRIMQECLQNIYKYSEATLVNLSIKKVLDRIIVDLEDNGVGFEVEKAKEGIGLKNMSSRVNALNGEFKVYSAVSKGTHINISFPY